MSERPPIIGIGTIVRIREPGRLFDVRMANGYIAVAVLPKDAPRAPEPCDGVTVEVAFSPYDMSRCKIRCWDPEQDCRIT